MLFSGNYKVQLYDYNVKDYLPSAPGMGMLVEVRDPEEEVVLSRVSDGATVFQINISMGVYCLKPLKNSLLLFQVGQLSVIGESIYTLVMGE